MKYLCKFKNANGEKREVLVSLSPAEVTDLEWHLAARGPHGPGAPDGPLAKGYALRRAAQGLPRDFVALIDQAQRVTMH